MLAYHSNLKLNQIENEIINSCLKLDFLPHFISTDDYLAYELHIHTNKFKTGLIFLKNTNNLELLQLIEVNMKNDLIKNWLVNGRLITNPYICCDDILFNIIGNELEAFCIHSSYIEDEISCYFK